MQFPCGLKQPNILFPHGLGPQKAGIFKRISEPIVPTMKWKSCECRIKIEAYPNQARPVCHCSPEALGTRRHIKLNPSGAFLSFHHSLQLISCRQRYCKESKDLGMSRKIKPAAASAALSAQLGTCMMLCTKPGALILLFKVLWLCS
jgi:hypothetical protein